MTSNLGSESILEDPEHAEEFVMEDLKNHFRPEFINRIDEIIVFNPLRKDMIHFILDKIILETQQRLAPSNIHISLTEKAKSKVLEEAYDEKFGARPIKRYVTKNIETLLANELLKEDTEFNDTFIIDVLNDQFIIVKQD